MKRIGCASFGRRSRALRSAFFFQSLFRCSLFDMRGGF